MKISDIFRRTSQDTASAATQKVQGDEQALPRGAQAQSGPLDDSVRISSEYYKLAQLAKVSNEAEASSAEKVKRIKAEVEAGSYSVSSEEVAGSVISYLEDAQDASRSA